MSLPLLPLSLNGEVGTGCVYDSVPTDLSWLEARRDSSDGYFFYTKNGSKVKRYRFFERPDIGFEFQTRTIVFKIGSKVFRFELDLSVLVREAKKVMGKSKATQFDFHDQCPRGVQIPILNLDIVWTLGARTSKNNVDFSHHPSVDHVVAAPPTLAEWRSGYRLRIRQRSNGFVMA